MKKVFYPSFIIIFLSALCFSASGQQLRTCAAEDEFQLQAAQDSSLLQIREEVERITAVYTATHSSGQESSVVRIIPTVVHVIHEGGPENISDEQIKDQIRTLNEDLRKLNADTNQTPVPFRPLAADCNVEFRLAQLDLNGNCTNGIVRKQSHLSDQCYPRDRVKAVSYWNSTKYFNIWVVKAINSNGSAGTILGYAQFPGMGASTDGIVLRSDYFGSIGTSQSNGYLGRTATHEVGHWLNLRHIWGDDNGACTGTDLVLDTPNQGDQIFGCPGFPYLDNCATVTNPSNPGDPVNGSMFPNYMDYTDGDCQSLFTNGQKVRMDAALNAYRSNLYSATNLVLTGTDGTAPVTCLPVADFVIQYNHLCEGDSIVMLNNSYNADTLTYAWSFPGGSPSSSTAKNPVVAYATAGTYDVSLTTTSSAGTDTFTRTSAVYVYGDPALAPPFQDDFETAGSFPGNEGYVENADNHATFKWSRIAAGVTAASGVACLKMRNSTSNYAGEIDSWVTPSFDLTNYSSCQLKYKLAYAQYTTANTDYLKIYYSTTCGKYWQLRQSQGGTTLRTTTSLINNFSPTQAAQWSQETVALGAASLKPNVRFKFEFTAGPDNNLYIDDIEVIGNYVGIAEMNRENLAFSIAPNPAAGMTFISFNTAEKVRAEVSVSDMLGKHLMTVVDRELETGAHGYYLDTDYFAKGIYFITVKAGETSDTQKLIIQ